MNTIWVFQDTGKGLNQLDFLLLCTSVIQYKRHHPTVTTVLYVDRSIYSILGNNNALSLWDQVNTIPFSKDIDTSVFWAAAKLEVISRQKDSFRLLDHDFIVYENIDHTLDGYDCVFTNTENGKGYYPLTSDEYIRKLSYKRRWKPTSLNVSSLYFKDAEYAKKYANLSLQLMREFTKMKVPHSQYLIFAEQLLLYHMLVEDKVKSRPLIEEYWDCDDWYWGKKYKGEGTIDKGLYSVDKSEKSFIHYGPLKGLIKIGKANITYDELTESLTNVVLTKNVTINGFTSK